MGIDVVLGIFREETAIVLGQDLALWGSSYSIPVSNAGRGW